jgi:formate-dependent nitrite reductase membrane component NrfD
MVRLTDDERQRLVHLTKSGQTAASKLKQAHILLPKGVPAWNQRPLPWLFLSSGLLTGAALLLGLVLLVSADAAGRQLLGAVVFGLTLVDLGCWLWYLRQAPVTPALAQALRGLTSPLQVGRIVGVGHVLPLLLLGSGLYASPASPYLLLAAGAGLWLGSLCLKDSLVTRAGYLVGLPIPGLRGPMSPLSATDRP